MTGDSFVLPGLIRKRAELARDLILAESKADELRAALAAIDDAIRVFDPTSIPASIKPKRARTPVTPLPYGHPSRMMLDILRTALEPMTARQIAEELARRCGLAWIIHRGWGAWYNSLDSCMI